MGHTRATGCVAMVEHCRTLDQCLASCTSLEELNGMSETWKANGAEVTTDDWAKVAAKKIELQKAEQGK